MIKKLKKYQQGNYLPPPSNIQKEEEYLQKMRTYLPTQEDKYLPKPTNLAEEDRLIVAKKYMNNNSTGYTMKPVKYKIKQFKKYKDAGKLKFYKSK